MEGNLKFWIRKCAVMVLVPVLMALSRNTGDTVRDAFYNAFSSGDTEKIDKAIGVSKSAEGNMARAYEGALLMKKAHLIKGPGEKLKMFKTGHELFEKEIAADPDNAELRFIRLCVQENAPRIVKYRDELEEDKLYVIRAFPSLPAGIRKHIQDYAGSSGVITPEDLK